MKIFKMDKKGENLVKCCIFKLYIKVICVQSCYKVCSSLANKALVFFYFKREPKTSNLTPKPKKKACRANCRCFFLLGWVE